MKFSIVYTVTLFLFSTILHAQNTEEEVMKIYREREKLERINDVYIPKDILEAMTELDRLTDDAKAKKLISSPEDTVASKLHFSLGRWMQIHWGLEEGSRLMAYLKSRGLSFPDDMADLLIRCWYRHLSLQPLQDDQLISQYISMRRQQHLDRLRKSGRSHPSPQPKEEHRE